MKRPILTLTGSLAGLGCLLWFFPLFHVVPLRQARREERQAAFNPADFARTFWSDRLMKSLDRAADASKVVAAITADPAKAREQFGRTVGLSNTYYYFLRGSGRVVSATSEGVGLSLKSDGDHIDLLLPTGLLFGNAVRDATGLLDASDFPNSQDFNAIAAALNHLVETRVLPELKEQATAGRHVRFAGCVEVSDEGTDLRPLKLVPILFALE